MAAKPPPPLQTPLLGEPSPAENAARLKPSWEALCRDLGVAQDRQQKWWAVLEGRHSEPQRSYHTLMHLRELFDHLEVASSLVRDTTAVSLAIFFHDVVYDPRAGSPKNEQDSAVLFDAFGQEALPAGEPLGLAKGELIEKVRRWIVQTATHKTTDKDDEDCKLFMDFDMAILGSSPERYDRYSRQIRQEYVHVPESLFCKARGSFLAATAEGSDKIYSTEVFRASHEQRARENMAREAAELSRRLARCGLISRLVAEVSLSAKVKVFGKRLGKGGAVAAAIAIAALRPHWAAGAAAAAAVGIGLFGLKLAVGARYVRHPYPEPRARADTVVLAGSYNPPHLGHLEMLRYLSKAHKKVVAVIGMNPSKKYDVSPYQRQELLRAMVADAGLTNVEVVVWGSIIFVYARSIGASVMYRGIRTWKEDGRAEKYLEFQNLFYQLLFGHWPIPTAYLQGAPALTGVSSTLLRKRLAAGEGIADLVPEACAAAVERAYAPTAPAPAPAPPSSSQQ